MKLIMGEEKLIVQGIRPEEQLWGAYQFPHAYKTDDGIVVSVHVTDDNISSFSQDTKRWFKSTDNGESWTETDVSVSSKCGFAMPNGDRLYFPQTASKDVSRYEFTPMAYMTPATDMKKAASEGKIPLQDGLTFDIGGNLIYAYNADRLPPSLRDKNWLAIRTDSVSGKVTEEYIPLDWPYLTRVVYVKGERKLMRSVFPHGSAKIAPDGSVWISTYSGDGHINPETGLYSPYYSAEIFRSTDNGHSFSLHCHMEYPADGSEDFPYLSGGFSDNDFEFMADGTVVWFLRSAWYGRTGYEWSPMYIARSADGGKTWSKPEKFSFTGIFPSACRLENGVSLVCYARPGIFVSACDDDSGKDWSETIEIMTPGDRSQLANIIPEKDKVKFHDWDGACNNPVILPISDDSALIFYSDFYYPDKDGVKRKSILCRKITAKK